jgi:hypothetical protein
MISEYFLGLAEGGSHTVPEIDATVAAPINARMYTVFFVVDYVSNENPAGRIPKPSQRLQNVDPLATLTQDTRRKRQQKKPETPTRQPHGARPARPASIRASRQIQRSQNRLAVALLFTPRRESRQQPSQTQQQAPATPSPLVRNFDYSSPLHRYDEDVFSNSGLAANSGLNSDSDLEQDILPRIKSLNLMPNRSKCLTVWNEVIIKSDNKLVQARAHLRMHIQAWAHQAWARRMVSKLIGINLLKLTSILLRLTSWDA